MVAQYLYNKVDVYFPKCPSFLTDMSRIRMSLEVNDGDAASTVTSQSPEYKSLAEFL